MKYPRLTGRPVPRETVPEIHEITIRESGGRRYRAYLVDDALAGADLRGFPEGYLLPHAAVYAEDLTEAELCLDRLLECEFDAVLVYHGSSVTESARERLDRFLNFPGRPPEPVK
jgi:hypothetical protein